MEKQTQKNRETIRELALKDWSSAMIATKLNISLGYVQRTMTALRKETLLPPVQGINAAHTIRVMDPANRKRFGGMEHFRQALSMKDYLWLVKNTPEGMPSMEFVASLVRDARMEETDAD